MPNTAPCSLRENWCHAFNPPNQPKFNDKGSKYQACIIHFLKNYLHRYFISVMYDLAIIILTRQVKTDLAKLSLWVSFQGSNEQSEDFNLKATFLIKKYMNRRKK